MGGAFPSPQFRVAREFCFLCFEVVGVPFFALVRASWAALNFLFLGGDGRLSFHPSCVVGSLFLACLRGGGRKPLRCLSFEVKEIIRVPNVGVVQALVSRYFGVGKLCSSLGVAENLPPTLLHAGGAPFPCPYFGVVGWSFAYH